MRFGDFDFPDITNEQRNEIQAKTDANMVTAWMNTMTELVDVDVLWEYREFNRHVNNTLTGDLLMKLADDIVKNGIIEPIMLEYNPLTGLCKVGEGNHRLAVLKALGIKRVPAYLVRSRYLERSKDPARMAKTIIPQIVFPRIHMFSGRPLDYHYPSYFKPSVVLPEIAGKKRYAWTGAQHEYEELTHERLVEIRTNMDKIHDAAARYQQNQILEQDGQ